MQIIVSTEKEVTKAGIANRADSIIQKVKEGVINPLDVLVLSKALEELAKQIREGIKEEALTELAKYGKSTEINGVTLTQKEAGVRYDFSNTAAWCRLDTDEKTAAQRKKELEAQLKTLTAKVEQLDGDELSELNPPIKTSTTIIEAKIK